MFTGIIQAAVPIIAIKEKEHFRTHYIRLPVALLPDLVVGASVAHNGCCLTVTSITDDVVSFDLMEETLKLTNLGVHTVGDEVNVERAASSQAEIGGHLMSGHIMCTAELSKIVASENSRQIWFTIEEHTMMKYILHKGYIGVDGVSLTIGKVLGNRFCVHLIPETLTRTTLGKKRLSDIVNIEINPQTQAIIDTVERVLASRQALYQN
ncbi:riboflavin synthase [Candidatus Doolittlea endobia]|uniref:Riboflavin synthase n=1 Tax=Candidatus Doolittlea endobia TaxID=1778262 RepID=A0A143WSU5_9ENTR|nr:riboflavin synthase [Candidatus Doolittlea endobia]CUX96770.1 Riboflavin synthase [Candidatus Doolittlea endobia]